MRYCFKCIISEIPIEMNKIELREVEEGVGLWIYHCSNCGDKTCEGYTIPIRDDLL